MAVGLALFGVSSAPAEAQVRLQSLGRNPVLMKLEQKAKDAFARLDVDRSKSIDAQELVKTRRREFGKMDKQKTKYIHIGQYEEHFGKKGKDVLTDLMFQTDLRQEFHKLDRDLDKRVSRAEYLSPAYEFVARFDINQDGAVSEQELVDNITFKNPPTRPPLPPSIERRLAREGRLPGGQR